jgi:3-hydroxyisobutyrate dehydrogenase-like beta-hydroxyacid dehydrogenase
MKERVGFIGVGLMGHGMAKNILDKGHPLAVLAHRNRAPVEDLKKRGATEARSPKELAETCEVVILCVTGAPEVEAIVRGKDGLKAGAKQGLTIVDTSTSEPTLTIALAEELAPLGVTFIDAPLARTPKEAAEGRLGVMVGGTPEAFARIKPVLACFGESINHIGPVGAGHTMKLLNNFVSLGYGAIYSEALALARKVGITPKVFDSVIRGGRMDCGSYQTFIGYALEGNRESHKFALRNAHKDLRYLVNVANARGLVNPVSATVKNSYAAAEAQGYGDANIPLLVDVIAAANGLGPLHEGKRTAAE